MDKKQLKNLVIETRNEKNLDVVIDIIKSKFGSNFQRKFNILDVKKYISNTRNTYNNIQGNKDKPIDTGEIIDIDLSKLKKGEDLLESKGFNKDEYVISSAWLKDKENGLSAHINKKDSPLTKEDWEDIFKNIKSTNLTFSKKIGEYNYLINLADIHFGITTFQDIKNVLVNIKDYFDYQKSINKICINLLGDEFNSAIVGKSVTNSFTPLNKTKTKQALLDADIFFDSLFNILSPICNELHIYNTYGNHDGGNSFNYLHGLKRYYKNIIFHLNYDDTPIQKYRDYYLLENVGIMITHGDLGKGRFEGAFHKEAWEIYSGSKTRIILTGHLHNERVIETPLGNKIYQIGTNKALDNWSNKNIFLLSTTERNWQIFKLNKNELQGIEYI